MIFINTRPAERGKALTDFLLQQQINVIDLPLLEIIPCKLTLEDFSKLQTLANGEYKAVILVSESAVTLGLSALHPIAHNLAVKRSPTSQWIAVGEKTAQTFTQTWQATFSQRPSTIITPSQFYLPENNEGMLHIPLINNLGKGDKVLIWRGIGGREILINALQNRGIIVDSIDFYQRQLPSDTPHNFEQTIAHFPTKDAIVLITSLATWHNWVGLCAKYAVNLTDFKYVILQNRLFTHISKLIPHKNLREIDNLHPTTVISACDF